MKDITQRQFDKKLAEIQKKNKQIEYREKLRDEKRKYSFFYNLFIDMKTSNKLLFVSVLAIIAFTVFSLFMQYTTGIEVSSTLTTCWFSFFGGEITLLAGIKVSKVIKGNNGTVG